MPDSAAATFDRLSTAVAPAGTQPLLRAACVLGRGFAGLAAARVLADHAERVTIIEPDGPDAGANGELRPGVPQGYQVHTLLPGGRTQLERFFPGLVEEALGEGAVLATPDHVVAYRDDVKQIPTPNAEMLSSSRPFLESLIRRRVVALPNVEVVAGRATGLNYARGAVEGVRYVTTSGETVATTDFVVD